MAFRTFLLKSFTFASVAVDSKSTATIEETAQVNEHSADSSRAVNLITVDRQGASISIETFDQSVLTNSVFRTGSCGALVMVGTLRGCGDALTEATTVTITVTNATVINSTATVTSEGEGAATINFSGFDPNADHDTAASVITYA